MWSDSSLFEVDEAGTFYLLSKKICCAQETPPFHLCENPRYSSPLPPPLPNPTQQIPISRETSCNGGIREHNRDDGIEVQAADDVFEIAGYSLQKEIRAGKYIPSATFAVGGHDWRLRFYPAGFALEDGQDYAASYLQLISKADEVRVLVEFGLVNLETMQSNVVGTVSKLRVFSRTNSIQGFRKVIKRSKLEGLSFLRENRIVLECCVSVLIGTPVSESRTICGIQVPPSDLVDNLGKLLESGEGADVAFKVKDEVFHAHKIVLAMRSPVFMVELYGPMRDKMEPIITVEDMQPAVFKALLYFIYTDSFPGTMENLDEDENEEMIKLLLVAADRYAMERMKLMCENILSKRLNVGSVATTLALADQHHCSELKDACIQFINSSAKMDDLVVSQGYQHLKRACPTIFVDIWERSTKHRSM